MSPRINYSAPLRTFYVGTKLSYTNRRKIESLETLDQQKREQSVQRILYQRESEIPQSPMECISQKSVSFLRDITTIPFFKAGSFPPKTIRIVDQPMAIHDDYMKNYRPAPPPELPVVYPQVHHIMQHPGIFPHMMPPPPMPVRVGPLPSMHLPAPPLPNNTHPFNPYPMQGHPMYDPSMMGNPGDPYGMMNKTRMIYNPITKKPQNFRTVPCRRFHSQDGCERGDNCHFIHDFLYQGRPLPNTHGNNGMRRSQPPGNYNPAMPSYYPPPEPNNNRTY